MSVYEGHGVTLHHGDCLDVLRTLPDASVDSVVTDPPYGLEFMGKEWDSFKTYAGGNPNMKPQGATVGDSSAVTHGLRRKNPRCRRCGKLLRGNGSCKCPEPQPDTRTAEGANQFQFWCEEWAAECLRVLKPGGHLLAFGGTRTWHRLACAIEDAGFEVRDSIAWLYGSGFPKSLDVSKAIDKRRDWTALPLLQAKVREARKGLGISQSEAARRVGLIGPDESLGGGGFMWFETGMRVPTREQYPRLKAALGLDDECDRAFEEAEREVTGTHVEWTNRVNYALTSRDGLRRDKPATPDAERWQGWGTALKPAFEPVVVARKPLTGTVAQSVLTHGTGALNIDGCRISMSNEDRAIVNNRSGAGFGTGDTVGANQGRAAGKFTSAPAGRWPANVVLDETQAEALDEQSGDRPGDNPNRKPRQNTAEAHNRTVSMGRATEDWTTTGHADIGGASRFFYVAKADASERPRVNGTAHPTVKPLSLMRWLVRLVTPPGGTVLEPFAGSGTTVEACIVEGFQCIAIEREADYLPLIRQRIDRRRDPVEALRGQAADLGLFDLLGGEGA